MFSQFFLLGLIEGELALRRDPPVFRDRPRFPHLFEDRLDPRIQRGNHSFRLAANIDDYFGLADLRYRALDNRTFFELIEGSWVRSSSITELQ